MRDLKILRHFCEFCATFQPVFFYGTIVCDTGVLSRVSYRGLLIHLS